MKILLKVGANNGADKKVQRAAIIATLAETGARNVFPDSPYEAIGIFARMPGLWGNREKLHSVAYSSWTFYQVAVPLQTNKQFNTAWQIATKTMTPTFPRSYKRKVPAAQLLFNKGCLQYK